MVQRVAKPTSSSTAVMDPTICPRNMVLRAGSDEKPGQVQIAVVRYHCAIEERVQVDIG
jgi:hypothetical protein